MFKPRNEQERYEGVQHVLRMFDAQKKEMTPTMLQFHNETHVIRIISEYRGIMTCTVRHRERKEPGVELTIAFPKKNRLGVVWTFMRNDKLGFLAFEPEHPGIIRH